SDADGIDVFTRSIQIGKSAKPLTLLLLEDDKADDKSKAEKSRATLLVKVKEKAENGKDVEQECASEASLLGAREGGAFALEGKRVLVKIRALTAPAKFAIKICQLPVADKSKFEALADKKIADVDFDSITKKGGAPRWKPIETKGTPAKADDQAYVV